MPSRGFHVPIFVFASLILSLSAYALQPERGNHALNERAFFLPELYISQTVVPFEDMQRSLENRGAWNTFFSKHSIDYVFLDPRSGHPVNIVASIPLIPGKGTSNRISLKRISKELGRNVQNVTPEIVAALFTEFLIQSQPAIGIDIQQLGPVKATRINDVIWHLTAPQVVDGIRVRHSRYLGNINNGNLVIQGVENWKNVTISTKPSINNFQAVEAGFAYANGRLSVDRIWMEPQLEIIPYSSADDSMRSGLGYGHRLVWVFGFQRAPEIERWEVIVDAHSGEVISFQDTVRYIDKKITGGVYPVTSTEVCPDNIRCGSMQENTPMPFTNTGTPNQFTNSGGVFNFTAGTVFTSLSGPFVEIFDVCGPIGETSETGDLNLGGVNGQHDCDSPASGGNTASSRTAMYELNRTFELARGYLPENEWLNGEFGALLAVVNEESNFCNAASAGTEVFFPRGNSFCRNPGEIAGILDHEWGHGMDIFDSGGELSNSAEAYADIAAMFRLWTSCIGYGMLRPGASSCGLTQDGTGINTNENQLGPLVCDLDCSGVRDADYLKIDNGGNPLTAEFTCAQCAPGPGPCGTQVHCSGTPVREAAWNLVARELQNPPGTDVDANTSFIIGDRLFYLGSGNIGSWHNCSCPSTSDGCSAANGYMQWIAADDDDGNLLNGTPHMSDIFAAYNTNGIACNVPAPQDSGCAGAPSTAPVVSESIGSNSVTLNWNSVAGAAQYNVFRTDGHAGCDLSKALIGSTTELTFTDPNATNGRPYSYVVMAQASNSACFSAASSCVTAIPNQCAGILELNEDVYSCNEDTVTITLIDSDLIGAGSQNVSITSDVESTSEIITLTESPVSSGQFSGTIETTSGPPSDDDLISVENGNTITVLYSDASSCGAPQDVIKTATASCAAVLAYDSSTFADTCIGGGAGNDDGVLDPGEIAAITLSVSNISITDATGISAVVSTTTPDVTVLNGTTGFPDIPASGNATAFQPVTIAVNDTASCFSVIDLNIEFTTDQGSSNDSFQLQVGLPGSTTYNSEDVPKPIPDGGNTSSTITIMDPRTIADVNVFLNLTHTADGELGLFLVGPGGSPIVVLSTNNGGSGDNYTFTVFDDEAPTPITSGVPPFTGFFQPEGSLAQLDGLSSAGEWALALFDGSPGNSGNLLNWSMNVVYTTPPQCNVCESPCPAIILSPPSLPDGGIGQLYNQTITASGGVEPYTFSLTGGALPDGLNIDSGSGTVSGTPTIDGTFNFEIAATDFNGCTGVQSYTVTIAPCPLITVLPSTLPDGVVSLAYSQTVSGNGGSAPYTFAITAGGLPSGLSLNPSTGNIAGVPINEESVNFTITATDANGCSGSQAYLLIIARQQTCLFCDDFDDGILAADWTYLKSSTFWSESNGNLIGTNIRKATAAANPVFAGCANCYVETTMQTAGGFGNRVWLLHHFIDKNNFVELLMKEEQDRWIIKQRINKRVVAKIKAQQTIDPNVPYIVRITFDGANYTVSIDGTPILTLTPTGAISGGTVGVKVKGTTGTFGYIEVN